MRNMDLNAIVDAATRVAELDAHVWYDQATAFTCDEADAVAGLLRAYDRHEQATVFLERHVEGDEDGDSHLAHRGHDIAAHRDREYRHDTRWDLVGGADGVKARPVLIIDAEGDDGLDDTEGDTYWCRDCDCEVDVWQMPGIDIEYV